MKNKFPGFLGYLPTTLSLDPKCSEGPRIAKGGGSEWHTMGNKEVK
jgi:hypothetical protein